MAQLEALGADTGAIRRALRSRECNPLTATYHLQLEAHVEAQRAAAAREREAAAERAAVKRAVEQQRGASSSADWQWDFAAISAHATAADRSQAAPASSQAGAAGSGASSSPAAGSSGLRGSASPARLRVAAAPPAGSPTRFGMEAAAAGYVASPRRPTTSGTATPTLHFGGTPFSSPPPAQAPSAAQRPDAVPLAFAAAEQQQQPRPVPSEPFTIKAVRAPPGSGEPSVSTPVAAAAAAAELAATPGLITASAVTTTTAVVEGEGPTSPSKSPRLAPLPGGPGVVLPPRFYGWEAAIGSSGHGVCFPDRSSGRTAACLTCLLTLPPPCLPSCSRALAQAAGRRGRPWHHQRRRPQPAAGAGGVTPPASLPAVRQRQHLALLQLPAGPVSPQPAGTAPPT